MTNIQDVARQAGVSISTVSRVLNGSYKVKSEVKKKVEASMLALSYRPNSPARSLRTSRSRTIGLVISDIQNPYFIQLIRGVAETLIPEYSLILCNTNEDPGREQQCLEELYAERVAGTIIVPTREWLASSTLNKFRERNIPIVAVDRRIKDKYVDAVLVDNVGGAQQAVTHLINNGYRRVGIITGPLTVTTGQERLEGYRRALKGASIKLDPALERIGTFDTECGRRLTDELLKLHPPIDAIFLCNNFLTVGAWDSIHAHNLKVPQDIGLIGYDETYWASLNALSLTTVNQPVYELGCTAVLHLFHRLKDSGSRIRQEALLSSSLNVRGSSLPREVFS